MAPKMESLHHSTDNNGFTMLHVAAQYGHAEVVQLAIDEYKLDPTARTKVCVVGLQVSCKGQYRTSSISISISII